MGYNVYRKNAAAMNNVM